MTKGTAIVEPWLGGGVSRWRAIRQKSQDYRLAKMSCLVCRTVSASAEIGRGVVRARVRTAGQRSSRSQMPGIRVPAITGFGALSDPRLRPKHCRRMACARQLIEHSAVFLPNRLGPQVGQIEVRQRLVGRGEVVLIMISVAGCRRASGLSRSQFQADKTRRPDSLRVGWGRRIGALQATRQSPDCVQCIGIDDSGAQQVVVRVVTGVCRSRATRQWPNVIDVGWVVVCTPVGIARQDVEEEVERRAGQPIARRLRRAGRKSATDAGTVGVDNRRPKRTAGRRDAERIPVVGQRTRQGPRIGVAAVGRKTCHRGRRSARATGKLQRGLAVTTGGPMGIAPVSEKTEPPPSAPAYAVVAYRVERAGANGAWEPDPWVY